MSLELDYTENTCLICKSRRYHIIANKIEGGREEKTVICKNCGLIYRILNPDNDYSNKAYYGRTAPTKDDLIKSANRGVEISNWIINRLRDIKIDIAIDDQKSMLDLGSGCGGVLEIFRSKYGCKVFGVEPDESFAEYSSTVMNVPTINKRFEDAEIETEFDIIIMSHVIFCFVNPHIALRKARDLLKKEGILYISVGNYLAPKKFGGLESYLFKSHVLYYFTPKTLSLLLNMNNFSILTLDIEKKGEIKFLVRHHAKRSDNQLNALNRRDCDDWKVILVKLKLYDYVSKVWRVISKIKRLTK